MEKYVFQLNELYIKKKCLYEKISLEIPTVGISLLTGKSGVGKTTLLNNLFVDNKDSCVLISQNNDLLIDDISVMDNICMNSLCTKEEIIKVLQVFDMVYLLKRSVKHLSGSEKRIVQILRGFFSERSLLLIDEPTNNLDVYRVNELKSLLVYLSKKKSIFIVTHDDRLRSIAETIFVLEDRIIKKEKFFKINSVTKLIKKPMNNIDVLRKLLKKSLFSRLLFLMLTLFFLFSELYLYSINDKFVNMIPDNQIDLCSTLYSNSMQLLKQGYIPTALYANEINKASELENIKLDDIEKIDMSLYSLNLNIPENDNYDIYEFLIIDMETGKIHSIPNYYWKKFFKENNVYPNTDTILDIPSKLLDGLEKGIIDTKIIYDDYLILLNNIKKSISKENIQIAYYTLLYNDNITFKEIVNDASFKNITNANYFIRSNETIKVYNNSLFLSSFKEVLFMLLILGVIFILVSILNIIIDLILNKKKFICFRNLGYDSENVISHYIKCSYDRTSLVIFNIVLLIGNILLVLFSKINGELLYLIYAVFFIIIMLNRYMVKIIIKKYINNIFYFGGIYDCL